MEYDQRYNEALGYLLDLYIDNHIVDSITVEQFKELFDMFIDSKKDIDRILYGDEPREEIVQLSNEEFYIDLDEGLERVRQMCIKECSHLSILKD
ncbi:hypothetical protein EJM73_19565 [Clostridium botulinum]|uniref:hypothetical protein n=1 Tax=Clostridium botulinum TaxID=1491 RepID=UPI0013761B5E|nr:hypothetical protein [Clostridium botulinum]NCI22149.1 hypothetical protein [Clostridium botulinum]NCI37811.1 hypothetical protein [Clostridium botulinum]NCI74457.1 hypothetical protein [Clostridium botulinum]NDI40932.1 hypothetical protein [Clostridium botulinum]NFA13558.1 hypothetical protein [Clostridium botulinum]